MRRIYLCNNSNCQANGCEATYRALEQALWEAKLLSTVALERTGCQDHCRYGPNLIVQPDGVRFAQVDAARAAAIVTRYLRDGDPLVAWQPTPEMRGKK